MVLLLSGKMGSGKTTLANAVADRWEQDSLRKAVLINFADGLYEMHDFCLNYLSRHGIPVQKKDRKLLQWLGTEWGREYDADIWIKILKSRMGAHFKYLSTIGYEPGQVLFIIGDARFENEADAFPDALKIRLECASEVRKKRCTRWTDTGNHPSETGLDRYFKWNMKFDTTVASVDECVEKLMTVLMP